MASEQNEQLVQEIVGDVLSESMKEDPKQENITETVHSAQVEGLEPEVGDRSLTHSAHSNAEDLLMDNSIDVLLDNVEISPKYVIDGIKGLSMEDSAKENKEEENDDISAVSPDEKGSNSTGEQQEKDNSLQESSENANNLYVNELPAVDEAVSPTSPTSVEPKLDTSDEEDKNAIGGKPNENLEVNDAANNYDAITPPALAQAEEHKLEQHQQQTALFAMSAVAVVEEGAFDSVANDSDIGSNVPPPNSSKTKNGGDNVGKNQPSSDGKPEQKTKTKLCTIL